MAFKIRSIRPWWRFSFKTGFSVRALFGTLGSDDFTLKVSPNGSSFFDALVAGRCSNFAGIYHQAVAGKIGDAFIKLTRVPDPHLAIHRHTY